MAIGTRRATNDADWSAAMELLARVYVGEGYTTPERARAIYQRAVLEPEGTLLVAVRNHGPVCGAVLLLNPDSTFRELAQPGEREFRFLAVDSGARGEGAGAALVTACMEHAHNAKAVVLWTRPVMLAAQRLYTRLGFARCAERDTDDVRGFKRLVFRKALGAG